MQLYGWFSQQAIDHGCGTCFYRTAKGGVVEVTCVNLDPAGESYKWEDKVCVGKVTEWVRDGRKRSGFYEKMQRAGSGRRG